MREETQQSPVLIGVAILLVAVIVIFAFWNSSGRREGKSDEQMKTESTVQPAGDLKAAKKATDHVHGINDTANGNAASANKTAIDGVAGDKLPRHQDMLSEEMKQAIRDDLILHGPQETFEKPDGTVVLPSSGRSTQVSVAVQMPDGSIQIREYSELPKDSKPVYTVAPQPSN